MKIEEMTLEDVETRISEIESTKETIEDEEALSAMVKESEELMIRKAELEDQETRKALAEELNTGATKEVTVVEEMRGETNMKDVREYRNSEEYINAFAEFIKSGDATECRALLSTNVGEAGEVAVPDMVSDVIKTDWLDSQILSLVRTIEVPGNFKQQFELSAGDAVIHNEGSGAVSEESLELGVVTLIAESIKKWISVSDEVLDLRGKAFLDYVVKEISHKISVKAEDVLIGKIKNLSTSASETAVCAKQLKAGAALTTIAKARGKLNAEARNPVVVMNPETIADFEAVALTANFAADIFRGMQVIPTNSLPALADATENQVYAIVGDFGFGALANFPNGKNITIKVDDKGQMKKDLVDILGRQYVALEPVACRAFVNITAPAAL